MHGAGRERKQALGIFMLGRRELSLEQRLVMCDLLFFSAILLWTPLIEEEG